MELRMKYNRLVKRAKNLMQKGDISNYIKTLIELQNLESQLMLRPVPVYNR